MALCMNCWTCKRRALNLILKNHAVAGGGRWGSRHGALAGDARAGEAGIPEIHLESSWSVRDSASKYKAEGG